MKTFLSKNNKGKLSDKKKGIFSAWLLLIPAVFALYVMIWRPTVTGIFWSFFKMKGYTPTEFIGLDNYINVISDSSFLPTIFNTIKYVFWSFVIGFVPPVLIAFFINEMVHFKNGFRISIYTPAIMPGVTILLLWYFIYSPDSTGLLNQILIACGKEPYIWLNDADFTIIFIVIQMTWAGFPASMFLYYTTIQSIPSDLYEAATIDGAGFFRKLWHIGLPQISGLLILNAVRQIIGVFQILQEPMVLTGGGPNNASTSVGYQMYKYGFVEGRVGQALALGTITFVILIVATVFYFNINKKIEENQG